MTSKPMVIPPTKPNTLPMIVHWLLEPLASPVIAPTDGVTERGGGREREMQLMRDSCTLHSQGVRVGLGRASTLDDMPTPVPVTTGGSVDSLGVGVVATPP